MKETRLTRRHLIGAAAAMGTMLTGGRVLAQSKGEIRIGQTAPYSGPASAYSTSAKTQAAYFQMINDQGGVNGRMIKIISLDDSLSPPKTVEQVRKLIEQEQVLALFGQTGTASIAATSKYITSKQVPNLFIGSGAARWSDAKESPWSTAFNLSYSAEAAIYGRYVLKTKPGAKIAVFYQNDDFGKDYLIGLKRALGADAAKMIVAEASYEITDPTVDSQILTLKASGADTFMNFATAKFAAQAIRKIYDLGWTPLHMLSNVSASVGATLAPAGLDKSVGILTVQYYKDVSDPQWKDDPMALKYRAFMARYYREASMDDSFNVYGYIVAQTMVQVFKQCGNDLSRQNLMKQALSIKNFKPDLLVPGVSINTSDTNHGCINQAQLARFGGKQWALFGDVLSV
jgi:ABC-type branched-subunit amino acid transport system substrate-binding protein